MINMAVNAKKSLLKLEQLSDNHTTQFINLTPLKTILTSLSEALTLNISWLSTADTTAPFSDLKHPMVQQDWATTILSILVAPFYLIYYGVYYTVMYTFSFTLLGAFFMIYYGYFII